MSCGSALLVAVLALGVGCAGSGQSARAPTRASGPLDATTQFTAEESGRLHHAIQQVDQHHYDDALAIQATRPSLRAVCRNTPHVRASSLRHRATCCRSLPCPPSESLMSELAGRARLV